MSLFPEGDSIKLGDRRDLEEGDGTKQVYRYNRRRANSFQRQRVESINNRYKALRGLLPCGDEQKMTKAAIIQKTISYIQQILAEKSELIVQSEKRTSGGKPGENPVYYAWEGVSTADHAVPFRKQGPGPVNRSKRKASTARLESVEDEGVASLYSEQSGSGEDVQSEVTELRVENMLLRLTLKKERLYNQNLHTQMKNLHLQNESLTQSVRNAEKQDTGKMSNACPAPGITFHDEASRCSTVGRHKLDSIVEAIRMLEGDRIFANDNDHHHNDWTQLPRCPDPVEEVEVSTTYDNYITP